MGVWVGVQRKGGDWIGNGGCASEGGVRTGDAGGYRALRFKPVPYIGVKEIGAVALGPGLGHNGQEQG